MRRFLSLGAGVQSSTLYCMAALDEWAGDAPEAAIFSDVGWEPPAVKIWLDFLDEKFGHIIPIHRVGNGNIREHMTGARVRGGVDKDGKKVRWAAMPLFTEGGGMIRRQCTYEYKIRPVVKMQRELLGYEPRKHIPINSCEAWIGISIDEAIRMKPSRDRWVVNRWPLIEKSMSRNDCKLWMTRHGFPEPPRSSCVGCPFHSDLEWLAIKSDPDLWADAVDFDRSIRKAGGMRGDCFLHAARIPLNEINFDKNPGQLNLFNNECEGMCGV